MLFNLGSVDLKHAPRRTWPAPRRTTSSARRSSGVEIASSGSWRAVTTSGSSEKSSKTACSGSLSLLGSCEAPNFAVPGVYVDFLGDQRGLVSYPSRHSSSSPHEPLSRSQSLLSRSRCCRSRIARASRLAAQLATKWRHEPGCGVF